MNYYSIPGLKSKVRVNFKRTLDGNLEQRKQRVIDNVCSHYKVCLEDLVKKTRKRNILKPRQVAVFLLHKMLGMGCVSISEICNQDHTSVLHTFKHVQDMIDTEEQFAKEIEEIEDNIYFYPLRHN